VQREKWIDRENPEDDVRDTLKKSLVAPWPELIFRDVDTLEEMGLWDNPRMYE
jgi:hypothetical protein